VNRLQSIYDWATTKVVDRLRDPFLLVLRLIIGYQFFITGKGKFEKIDNVVNFLLLSDCRCRNSRPAPWRGWRWWAAFCSSSAWPRG